MAQQAPNGLQAIIGSKFICKDKDGKHVEVTFEDRLKDAKAVAIYFSAHWCPPCRGFTPILTAASAKWKDEGVEIIFVTSDQNDKSFKEYYASMGENWLSYPFGHEQIQKLGHHFKVQGIPKLVVVDKDGKVLDDGARGTVMQKKENSPKEWLQ